jgi:hypothetical protein
MAWVSSRILTVTHPLVPWWLDAPSSLAFYGALYAIFDKYLWRKGLVFRLGLVRIPNLAGLWHGYLVSSFDGHEKRQEPGDHYLPALDAYRRIPHDSHIDVTQLRGSDSSGRSGKRRADLPVSESAISRRDENDAHALRHCDVERVSNGGCLAGDYYAGRDRRTFGRICCRRQLRSPQTDAEIRLYRAEPKPLNRGSRSLTFSIAL